MRLLTLLLLLTQLYAITVQQTPLRPKLVYIEPTPRQSDTDPLYRIRGFARQPRLTANTFLLTPDFSSPVPWLQFSDTTPARREGPTNNFILNEFTGTPNNWRTRIPTWQSVTYLNVRPGIDLTFTPRPERNLIEVTAVLAPGLASSAHYFDSNYSFVLRSPTSITVSGPTGNEMALSTPSAWQLRNGAQVPLSATFTLASTTRLAITPTSYDPTLPLYLSLNIPLDTEGFFNAASAFSPAGRAYFALPTLSPNRCSTTSGGRPVYCTDVTLAAISPTGDLLYLSRLAGDVEELPSLLAIATNGDVVLAGTTSSANFPTTPGALQSTTNDPLRDAFLVRLHPTTGDLLAGTLYGRPGESNSPIKLLVTDRVLLATGPDRVLITDLTFSRIESTARLFLGGTALVAPDGDLIYWDQSLHALIRLAPDFTTRRYQIPLGTSDEAQAHTLYLRANGNLWVTWSDDKTYLSEFDLTLPREISRTTIEPLPTFVFAMTEWPDGTLAITASPTRSDYGPSCGVLSVLHLYSSAGKQLYRGYLPPAALYIRAISSNRQLLATPLPSIFTIDPAAPTPVELTCVARQLAISPGRIISLLGHGFGDTATEVTINGAPTPILYWSEQQINTIAPFTGLSEDSPATITVRTPTGTAARSTPVLRSLLEIFPGAILNQDGTLNTPTNPAPAGSIIILYGTGLGRLNITPTLGSIAPLTPPFARPLLAVSATFNGRPAEVLYAGQAPGLIYGAAQFNIRLPLTPNSPPNYGDLSLALDNVGTPDRITIWTK